MIKSDEKILFRLPADLKSMFTALCENENVTVSAKLKKMIGEEVQRKLDMSQYRQMQSELMPRKQNKAHISRSDDIQATTLPQQDKTPVNAQKSELKPLDNAFENCNGIQNFVTGEIETNKLLLGALNSAKKRQNKTKKKR
jgi:hypothetical protein